MSFFPAMPKGEGFCRTFLISVLLFLAVLVCPEGLLAEGPVCKGCHRAKSQGKVVHPIINSAGCTACHTNPHATKTKSQKFLLKTGEDLCFTCHDKARFTRPVQHPPVAQGQCLLCHGVHISENEKLLNAPVPELCFDCHDRSRFLGKTIHQPAGSGMCTSCHDPHSSMGKKLVVAEPPDLCFTCHDKKLFVEGNSVHSPVATGLCTSCHKPHVSDEQKLLAAPPPGLCFTCHTKGNYDSGREVHPPAAAGMCTTCHLPHQSPEKHLLSAGIPFLCYTCHEDTKFTGKRVHPPVASGLCIVCHMPHRAFMKPLLVTYVDSINDLCLKCHPRIRSGHIVTGFSGKDHPVESNGPVVVDGQSIKLSCVSCHNPHSSESGRLFSFQARTSFELCSYCHKK